MHLVPLTGTTVITGEVRQVEEAGQVEEAMQVEDSSGRVGQGGSVCARPGSAEQTECNRHRMAEEGRRLGQAVQSITTRIMHEGTVDYGTGDWRVYRVIQGQMRVVDAMVEGRLRSDRPGARSLWRTIVKVRVLGLGRLVEGLERGRSSRTFGYWRCVVRGRGEVPKGA